MDEIYKEVYTAVSFVLLKLLEDGISEDEVYTMISRDIMDIIPNISDNTVDKIIIVCEEIANEVYNLAYSRDLSMKVIKKKVDELLEQVDANNYNYYQISQQLKQIWRENEKNWIRIRNNLYRGR